MSGERTQSVIGAINLGIREELRQEMRVLRSWWKNGDISRDEYEIELIDRVFRLEVLRFDDRPLGESRRNPRAALGVARTPQSHKNA